MTKLTEHEAYDLFDEMLDELSTFKIGNLEYPGSQVLKAVDPIAYRNEFIDFLDSRRGEYEVEGY